MRRAARTDANKPEIVVTLPIRAVSVANVREHWASRASRARTHRATALFMLRQADNGPRLMSAVEITMTRIAPRKLDDDNLRGALKAARDGIADWLGVPDNDPRISWEYAQERGKPKEYAVRVEVTDVESALRAVRIGQCR